MNFHETIQVTNDSKKNKEAAEEAVKEFKKKMQVEIFNFKENIAKEAVKDHLVDLNEGNIGELGDYDLRAFNEVVLKGGWDEKSKELDDYLDDFKKYREKKKQDGTYEPLTDLRRNFSGMIRTYLIDKAINEKLEKKHAKV